MDFLALLSGSDIRGIALGDGANLTVDAVSAITDAFVFYLEQNAPIEGRLRRIAVGHDSRLSAAQLEQAVIDSLKRAGCEVFVCGLASTPSMFGMTQYGETDCDAAIMLTASHHPADRNGMKFFTKAGGLTGAQVRAVLDFALQGKSVRGTKTIVYRKDFLRLYCQRMVDFVVGASGLDQPLAGFRIVVDAGNGAGGFFAHRILQPLGADISGSQFLEPDGNFPNHSPNPEDSAAMDSIRRRVVAERADLGIIFDTDVDRAAIVDASGREINRNRLIALISAILLEERAGVIVTDSVTSEGLGEFIERRGGTHHRFKRGYNNVIGEAKRLTAEGKYVPIAIETSGHAAFAENGWLDDGAYLAVRLLIKLAQLSSTGGGSLGDYIADLREPCEEGLARIYAQPSHSERALALLAEIAKEKYQLVVPSYEGVRAKVPQFGGWFLARTSVHDPYIVINIESDQPGGVSGIAKCLAQHLDGILDTSALAKLASN